VEALANADVLVAEHDVLDVVRTHARPGVAVVNADTDPSSDPLPGTGTPHPTVVDVASTPMGIPAVRDAAHLVMEAARGGRRVVRAVSGDPGLDTYAAEEMLACAAAGVPFEVVPGVAAAVGVPAYAGVPLRDAQGADVRFVDARTASDRCWTEVGASDGTVVDGPVRRADLGPAPVGRDRRRLDDARLRRGRRRRAGVGRAQARYADDGDGRRYDDPAADVERHARDHRADAEAGEGAALARGRPAGDSRGR
jgi:hypothetical protein